MKRLRVPAQYLPIFCRELHQLVRTGIPLAEGLTMLREDETDPDTRSWLEALCRSTEEGLPLASALRETGAFPAYMTDMVSLAEETGRLEDGPVVVAGLEQGAGDAMAQSAGLTADAAALDSSHDVHLALAGGGHQGLTDDHLEGIEAEVLLNIPAVDGDGAGAAGVDLDAGDRGLSAASAVQIGLFRLIHVSLPPYSAV